MVIMNRYKKNMIMVILCLGIIAGIVGLIYLLSVPKTDREEISLYEYTIRPNLTYEVHLIENDLYVDTVQTENGIYIKKLIDYINIFFDMDYKASESSSLHMNYEIVASVIGYNSNKDNRTDYWKKDYSLSDEKTIDKDATELKIKENIKLYFEKYDEFAKHANEVTGINLTSELIIRMVGNITAETSYGSIQTPFDIPLTIPLQNNIVTVTKGYLKANTDRLTETVEVNVPINIKQIVFIIIGIALCIVLLVFLFIFVGEPTEKDVLRRDVLNIIKKHSSRMVALDSNPNKKFLHSYEVKSIRDLLIISDDVQKPIYYILDHDEIAKNYCFHVEDKGDIYNYRLSNDFRMRINYDIQAGYEGDQENISETDETELTPLSRYANKE